MCAAAAADPVTVSCSCKQDVLAVHERVCKPVTGYEQVALPAQPTSHKDMMELGCLHMYICFLRSSASRQGVVTVPEVWSVYMVHEWPHWPKIDRSFHAYGLCAILSLSQSRSQSVTLTLIRNFGSALYIFVQEFAITGT